MKKLMVLLLVAVLLLTGCHFNVSIVKSDKSIANVEALVDALLAADRETALDLMHSGTGISEEELLAGMDQIIQVFQGKTKEKLEQVNFKVTTRVGTDSQKVEQGEYLLTTTDGAQYTITYTYWKDSKDSGMAGFHVNPTKGPDKVQ